MVRTKSVLNMIMMSFSTIGVVSIVWLLFGYSLAFTGTGASGTPTSTMVPSTFSVPTY